MTKADDKEWLWMTITITTIVLFTLILIFGFNIDAKDCTPQPLNGSWGCP